MIVNDERKSKSVPFSEIKCGEVFSDEGGSFMMRINPFYDANDVFLNAVDLGTGYLYNLEGEESVIRINSAILTIQN